MTEISPETVAKLKKAEERHEGVTLNFDDVAALLVVISERAELERRHRHFMWLGHGHSGMALYGDDGEMQCSACDLDFKRAPLAEIGIALRKLAIQKAASQG